MHNEYENKYSNNKKTKKKKKALLLFPLLVGFENNRKIVSVAVSVSSVATHRRQNANAYSAQPQSLRNYMLKSKEKVN